MVRIANIDISDLQAGTTEIFNFFREAYYKLHQRITIGGQASIYLNRDVLEALDRISNNQAVTDNFTRLRPMEVQGKEVLSYRDMPLRQTDALVNTEAQIL